MPGAIGRNSASDRKSSDRGGEAAEVSTAYYDWLHRVGWRYVEAPVVRPTEDRIVMTEP